MTDIQEYRRLADNLHRLAQENRGVKVVVPLLPSTTGCEVDHDTSAILIDADAVDADDFMSGVIAGVHALAEQLDTSSRYLRAV